MSISEKTVKCPHCGDLYKVYSYSVAEQSACHSCVRKAEEKMNSQNSLENELLREAFKVWLP